jgi:hypothetical protein
MKKIFSLIITFLVLSSGNVSAQIASGGGFTLEQTAIATGGGKSSGGSFVVEGTNAQAVAGTRSAESTKGLHGGFWNASPFAPTAANITIGGRVLTAEGQGIRNVTVTLTDGSGTIHTTVTGTFGYYNFAEIEAGQTVVISVTAKRYAFSQPSVVLSVTENVSEINFISNSF